MTTVTLKVHSFRLGDVDDPEIYAAQPLYKWQTSEQGQWVMEHAVETPVYLINSDLEYMGHMVSVRAKLNEDDATYFNLRWK